jgi:hypothetical protein
MEPAARQEDMRRPSIGLNGLVLWAVLGVMLLAYVGSYAVLRQQQVLVRVEYVSLGTPDPWQFHRIETGGAVEDPSRRRWMVWTLYWPIHRLESEVRCILKPLPGEE